MRTRQHKISLSSYPVFVEFQVEINGNPVEIDDNLNTATVNNSFNQIIDNTVMVSEQVRRIDPNFSSDKFLSWAREVFLKIQQAWTDRDWKVIRPFESNELFSQHSAQLQEYINQVVDLKLEKITTEVEIKLRVNDKELTKLEYLLKDMEYTKSPKI